MILPPDTRGFLLDSYNSQEITFLPWNELHNFLNTHLANLSNYKKEEVRNELYSRLIEYDPSKTVLWLKLAELPNGMIGLAHGKNVRPHTIESLSKRFKISKDQLLNLYYIWDSSVCTPEEAAEKVGLALKTVVELAEFFENTVPPNLL